MAQTFNMEFEDYIIFHRGIRNFYIDEETKDLHVVYQDGKDYNLGNPYGDYVDIAVNAANRSTNAAVSAKKWAIGKDEMDIDVPIGDETYQNNAKFYAESVSSYVSHAQEIYEEILDATPNIVHWNESDGHLTYYGLCTTAADTATKEINLINDPDNHFNCTVGVHLTVKFQNENTVKNVQLKIGNKTYPVLIPSGGDYEYIYPSIGGTCEFVFENTPTGWSLLKTTKPKQVIFADELPETGFKGQICLLRLGE